MRQVCALRRNVWGRAVAAAVVLLAAPYSLLAQVEGLPVKPGLWQSEVLMQSAQMPGGMPMTKQICYSDKMTMDQYVGQMTQHLPGLQCTVNAKKVSAHSVLMDESCSGGGMTTKAHVEIQIPDPEHTTGSSHVESTGSMQGPMNMTMDMKFTGKFISSDCGTVKPLVAPGGGM